MLPVLGRDTSAFESMDHAPYHLRQTQSDSVRKDLHEAVSPYLRSVPVSTAKLYIVGESTIFDNMQSCLPTVQGR